MDAGSRCLNVGLCLQEANRDLKDAQSRVTAKRRAFPRHAPGSHAAALEALEQIRQRQEGAQASQPLQVTASLCVVSRFHL
jgi:hypothetical protein